METSNENDMVSSVNNSFNLIDILFYSTQLGVHYHMWENNEEIHKILDLKKNKMCQFIQNSYPSLDEKSVKCVVMAMYLYMYSEINKICNTTSQQNNEQNNE